MQTDDHRAGLMARYGPEKLFQAERNFNAAQDLDVSIQEGDLVGVIKQQDPMGSNNRWLIDNGGRSFALRSIDHVLMAEKSCSSKIYISVSSCFS